MPLITWNPTFAVGIAEVDEQHKKLIDIINRLFDAMKKGKGKFVLVPVVRELVDYTVYHFGTEESLFREYGYPEYEEHKREHDEFTQRAIDFLEDSHRGQRLITVDVLDYLTEWLRHHILEQDKKFGPFLRSKGVS